MQRTELATIFHTEGFNDSLQPLDNRLSGTSARGSCNNLLLGQGYSKPHGGYLSKGTGTGSRIALQIGSDYGGISDVGATQGSGSAFEDVGKSIWGIGSGKVKKNGADVSGLILSSILQVSLSVAGVYSAPTTYQAGLPQPSAPDLGIPAAIGGSYTGLINGTISAKLVRLRLSTGGASRPSTTSAVVNPSKRTVRVTFPSASVGQDNWAVFFTQQGFGGVGLHYRAAYNNALDIPESVVAAGTVDGIARTLEFDFQDGDLTQDAAEISYIDNYPPPAGTHAVRLENVMCVLGCYADTVNAPSPTNPGTCIAVSLPNFYESYKPRNILFLPEQVVSVLSRPTDSYAWVGCRNSIYTLQYTGQTDAPACTVATAFPNIGVAYHHNWTQFYGQIAVFTAKGTLVFINEGGAIDDRIAAPIKRFIKDWLPQDTITGFDYETNSFFIANGGITLSLCLDNGKWSDPCYLADAGVAGNVLACVATDGKLIVTVNDGTNHTAYTYNTGATRMPVAKASNWQQGAGAFNLFEMEAALNCSNVAYPVAVALQRNLKTLAARGAVVKGSNVVTLSEGALDAASVGDKVFIYGENIDGTGVHYLTGKIGSLNSPTSFNLVTPLGFAISAQVNFSNCYLLFGQYVKVTTLSRTGQQHLTNLQPLVLDARSFAAGMWMMTNAQSGEFIGSRILGTGGAATLAKNG